MNQIIRNYDNNNFNMFDHSADRYKSSLDMAYEKRSY